MVSHVCTVSRRCAKLTHPDLGLMKETSDRTLLENEKRTFHSHCCNVLISDNTSMWPWQTVTGGWEGSKWCELAELWLSPLSRSTPRASRDSQRARCGLALLWLCQNKCPKRAHMHTASYSQIHTGKYKQWHRKTHINTCMGLPLPRATYSAQPVQRLPPSSSLCLSCSLYLSLLCLHSLYQSLVWSC